MTIKYLPLALCLSLGSATQAMEPADYVEKMTALKEAYERTDSYKEKMAILKKTYTYALRSGHHDQFTILRAKEKNEKLNHSLQKSHATAVDIQFAKAVEANDAAAVKETIAQGANINIKWFGKPALIHALNGNGKSFFN